MRICYIVKKMKTAYEKYSKEVGVIIPRGNVFAETEVTINLDKNIPNM
jgi:hypothetical protein